MYLSHLRIITAVYLLHHLVFTGASDSPVQPNPVDDIALNCGYSGSSSAFDGREWIGDMGSTFTTSPKEAKGKLIISSRSVHQSLCADHVPYVTARISRSQFTYTFQLSSGQKFIRLHFYPASYPGFERSKALLTVKAGPYTLLSNFSTSLAADALGVSYFAKEFCVNIEEDQLFNITFSPSKSTCSSYPDDDVYAFINGIEIVSMPSGLYYTPDGDLGPRVVGNKFFRYYIDNGTALEMVHRLNAGGRSILSIEDSGMYRMWSDDKNYLLQSSLLRVSRSNMITYTNTPTHSAPPKVYQTAWSIGSNQQTNQLYNFTWKLPVDLGFRYLVRLHFCELEPTITESGQKQFDLLIKNKKIEADADVIKWSGGNGAAVYRDYVVTMEGDRMEGRRDLIIALQLKYVSSTKQIDAIIKGIEIFKLSNPDINLAGVNPVCTSNDLISKSIPRLRKLVLAFGSINTIAAGIILVLTLLYFIVHLNRSESNHSKINISSPLEGYGSNNVPSPSWWWRLWGWLWLGITKANYPLLQKMIKKMVEAKPHNNKKEEHISEVTQSLERSGLESCNLIVGIDFTKSNEWKGKASFNRRCLHDIGDGLNPYEQSISIIGKTLADFAKDNLIPCFGFGDGSTYDEEVFSFYPDKRFCNGFEEVLSRYREIVPHLKLSGPTSFAPIIEMAMTVVEQSGFKYHILLLIADGEVSTKKDDGQVSAKERTLEAIVEASKFPLSIILVGVGDGPWNMMREFCDDIPGRAFNNFQFVNFTEIMTKNLAEAQKEKEFALAALTEIPSQNKAAIELNISGGRKGNAPGRVPLPPPHHGQSSPVGTAPPAPT